LQWFTKSCATARFNGATSALGAIVTGFLFMIGKSLIGWYIGTSAIAPLYGAAGALLVVRAAKFLRRRR
jgi:uncharacterized BrkB/YihY/UPF0761 family membrane protein